jgi:UDP-N-acetylmuramyl tripeptide synthase
MEANPRFIQEVLKNNPNTKIVLIAGTNGKTTTSLMLQKILEEGGLKVFRNEAGANLLNGIASSIIANANLTGRLSFDAAVFEVDERNVALALRELSILSNQLSIVLLNIFRDQLDRYGEVNQVLKDWREALSSIDLNTFLFTNGDDPALSYLAKNVKLKTYFFGIDEKLMKKDSTGHDVDFIYCPNCQTKLEYTKISYSHMGKFRCPNCGFTNPKAETFSTLPRPLLGSYNIYNSNAATLVAQKTFDIDEKNIRNALIKFKPAFGRQETIRYRNRDALILLSKNPAGFNQSISAVNDAVAGRNEQSNINILLVLNDRIPDGRDVSWIWDIEIESLPKGAKIFISGDRAYDMGLRIKYSIIHDSRFMIHKELKEAIEQAVSGTKQNETLFILPTYSAMLETRKILTGRSIL